MKLLITSVGSLLGQNVLDSIESRRNLIEVIGLNTEVKTPRNFRCDKIYNVNRTDSLNFNNDFLTIIDKENPDLILPGRDEDCIFLADIKSKHSRKFKNKIPFGSSFIPQIMFDKYKSYQFCKEHQLPFADSFLYNNQESNNIAGLRKFIDKHGYPIIAKPRAGFGSQGVYFILNRQHIYEFLNDNDIVFQEYLGNPDDIFKYKDVFKRGIPLFFQIPEKKQFAVQSVIHPNGTLSEVFFTINTMIFGRNEYIEQIIDEEIENIMHQFAKVFYKNGWYGPLNLQMKPDQHGKWKAFELSPRQTGSTSARTLLGFDDFGLLCDIFIPELKIPNLTKTKKVQGKVFKYLQDNLVLDEDIENLSSKKVWKKDN